MKILAFDASAAVGAVALTEDNEVIRAYNTEGTHTHSETLLPLAERALSEGGVSLSDIDLFACTVGPGSFTGVRIAVSLVKGLALPEDKPCVGLSSLEALAYPLRNTDGIVCPMIDARRGNMYNALFRGGERLCEDRLISLEALEAELAAYGEPVYLAGDAYDVAKARFTLKTEETPTEWRLINGGAVASAAYNVYKAGGAVGHGALRPEYLRPSQAEREREEKNNE
ncbi:MAG: tRNA (adenosine(37)-N6)-threonylcarbamoyltransferase complex dimerization subunit type 1 TsaB [Clostridia bacterium]|nr:tRNA (adenosine(37)-N6)-threonylcarbamoyltransferase complex dimerization subunit type 1 TsaB [Clostridia bacterium]